MFKYLQTPPNFKAKTQVASIEKKRGGGFATWVLSWQRGTSVWNYPKEKKRKEEEQKNWFQNHTIHIRKVAFATDFGGKKTNFIISKKYVAF